MINVILIGCGKMGSNHLRNLKRIQDVNIVGVIDSDEKRRSILKIHEKLPVFSSVSEFPVTGTVDCAILAVPTSHHFSCIKEVKSIAKRIFVEKPLCATFEEAIELDGLLGNQKDSVFVGFIERYNPAVEQIRSTLEEIGEIYSARFVRRSMSSARINDVDVIADLMVHDLDLAVSLFGEIKTLRANGVVRSASVESCVAMLTHSSGITSVIEACRVTHGKERTIKIYGEGATINCNLLEKEVHLVSNTVEQEVPGRPYRISSVIQHLEVKPEEPLLRELEAFLDMKSQDFPNFDDSAYILEISERIRNEVLKEA